MLTGRVLTGLAAACMLAAVVFNVVPATAVVTEDRPGRRVSCGTLLFATELSFSDACQDARVARITTGLVAWLAGLVLGAAGLLILYQATRRL